MKRLFVILINLVLIVSCSTSNDTTADTVEHVNVSLTPKIDYSIEPLTRAEITDKDYITIRITQLKDFDIYSMPLKETTGVFLKDSEIKFELIRGGYYLIRAFVLKGMVGKFTSFYDFDPNRVNEFYDGAIFDAVSCAINGVRKDHYPIDNYTGGIFFQAKEDINISLNMIHNVYGVTVNLTGESDGQLYICSVPCNRAINESVSYHEAKSGETLRFMYLDENFNWLTTGDKITHQNASYDVDVRFKYITSDNIEYYLPTITVPEVERGKNIIINLNTDDFIPAEGTVNFNIMGDGELEDTVYE